MDFLELPERSQSTASQFSPVSRLYSSSCGIGWRGAAQEAYTERVEFSDVSAKDLYIRESACISDIQESATDISFYCGYIQADATGSWIRPYGSLYIQAGATGSWVKSLRV